MKARVLAREVAYFACSHCGYVQTEQPTWLAQAYHAPINISDTGMMARNLAQQKSVLATLALLRKRRGKVVDYAGGYGLLVRLLRDLGLDAYWIDPYTTNLAAVGFEYQQGEADLVTAFEAFEYFVDPIKELETMLAIAPNVLFSTDLIPKPIPAIDDWWYYGTHHGQHIGFLA